RDLMKNMTKENTTIGTQKTIDTKKTKDTTKIIIGPVSLGEDKKKNQPGTLGEGDVVIGGNLRFSSFIY
ncbi:MAG: hypothetical protein KAJ51_10485, partial [Thermoplasmata archaeon]|nr:hypothetical protein [Thermoplasmata archaeon]